MLSFMQKLKRLGFTLAIMITGISANADGPRDAAYRKIDHIALPTEFNYQATSVG